MELTIKFDTKKGMSLAVLNDGEVTKKKEIKTAFLKKMYIGDLLQYIR